jgi:hypothetical protein
VQPTGTTSAAEPDYGAVPPWVRPLPLARAAWAIVAWCAANMALLAAWFTWVMPGNGWLPYLACAAPPVVAASTTFAKPADRRQYLLRPLAAAMMLPILIGFYASEAEGTWTLLARVLLGLWFLLLVLGFGAMVAWQATAATRLDSAAGIAGPAAGPAIDHCAADDGCP